MLSRVAENLFWLGRYLERADNIARLADVNYQAAVEQASAGNDDIWEAVLSALGTTRGYAAAREADPALRPSDFIIYSTDHPASLRSTVAEARRVARELREHISREVFEEINSLYLAPDGRADGSLRELYRSVKRSVAATIGMFDNTVLFTEGRDWFRCGMFLERAEMMTRIIDAKYFILLPPRDTVGDAYDRYQWMAILRSASALEAFRKRYPVAVTARLVVELLLFDQDFPRSLLFCVMAFRRHFVNATEGSHPSRTLLVNREVAVFELDLLAASASMVIESGLHEFLEDTRRRFVRIDTALSERIFAAVPEELRA